MPAKSSALKLAFLAYNRQWFDNRLPTDTIVKWSSSVDYMGSFEDGTITINSTFKRWNSVWRLTLLHEMAHLLTENEQEEHGPRWHWEMHRLARAGAFDPLW